MIPLNFSHLFYFYTIAKEGSVLKAGQALRLAQPTLSTQLKQFEDFLGKQLFERTGRRLVLTETGHYVLSYAKTIFDAGQECVSGLQDFNAKSPVQIQIGVTPFIPKAIIDALLNFILKSEHNIHLRVTKDRIETLLQNLGDNFLDVALTDVPSPASAEMHLDHHLVCTIPVVFCAHSSLARKIKSFPKDLAGMPMILPTAQSHIYHAILEYLMRHKVTPRIIAEIQDVELVRRLALAGHGIAPMNQFTALNAPAKKSLVILDRKVSHSIFDKIYLLIKKKQRTNPLVQKVIQDFKLSSFS